MDKGKKIGRPSIFNQELADRICERIACGETLRAICKDDDMPDVSTVLAWVSHADKESFSKQYASARLAQAQHLFDELLDIADDSSDDWIEKELKGGKTVDVLNQEHVQRSRLRVDTRKWYLSKVLPKIYGDKLDMTTNGKDIPQPLLHVLHNNGHKEDLRPEEAN